MSALPASCVLTAAMTWPMIGARLNEAAGRGDVPLASLAVLRSSLRAPLAEMVKSPLARSEHEFEEVNHVPFLSKVPEYVHDKAKRARNSRPGNAKCRAMQVLDAVFPGFHTTKVTGVERGAVARAKAESSGQMESAPLRSQRVSIMGLAPRGSDRVLNHRNYHES